jgi:hypothetical protein
VLLHILTSFISVEPAASLLGRIMKLKNSTAEAFKENSFWECCLLLTQILWLMNDFYAVFQIVVYGSTQATFSFHLLGVLSAVDSNSTCLL